MPLSIRKMLLLLSYSSAPSTLLLPAPLYYVLGCHCIARCAKKLTRVIFVSGLNLGKSECVFGLLCELCWLC